MINLCPYNIRGDAENSNKCRSKMGIHFPQVCARYMSQGVKISIRKEHANSSENILVTLQR